MLNFSKIGVLTILLLLSFISHANAVEVYGYTDPEAYSLLFANSDVPTAISERVGIYRIYEPDHGPMKGSSGPGGVPIKYNFFSCFYNEKMIASKKNLCVSIVNRKSAHPNERTPFLGAFGYLIEMPVLKLPYSADQGLDLLAEVAKMVSAQSSANLEQYQKVQQLKNSLSGTKLPGDLTKIIAETVLELPAFGDSDALTKIALFELYIKLSSNNPNEEWKNLERRPRIAGDIVNGNTLILTAENIPLAISKEKTIQKVMSSTSQLRVLIIKFSENELDRLVKKAPFVAN